jgi:hypothetical protein
MRLLLILFVLMLPQMNYAVANNAGSISQPIVQDPETKIIYYLESDLRHIAAISPDGKLLWRCQVTTITPDREKLDPGWHIMGF